MAQGHEHLTPESRALDARLVRALALDVAITAAEAAGGLVAGSPALLSAAAHYLSDAAAVGRALWARRPDRRALRSGMPAGSSARR